MTDSPHAYSKRSPSSDPAGHCAKGLATIHYCGPAGRRAYPNGVTAPHSTAGVRRQLLVEITGNQATASHPAST